MSIDDRTLNMALEQIFLFSLRRDVGNGIIYLGAGITQGELMNSGNISELVCLRLTAHEMDPAGVIGYLGACYKRIQQKEISIPSQKSREELARCV